MMKKTLAWLTAILLLLTLTVASANETENVFAQLEGIVWSFSSGAGAWSTDIRILPDGSFSGEFHDADMGDAEDAYPNGTVYLCSFAGTMSVIEQADANTWIIRVDTLKQANPPIPEEIEDGVRYVYSGAYGITEGDMMLLYGPGTPVNGFTEDMMFWAHLYDYEQAPSELETWFLYSGQNGAGFVGWPDETGVSLANPWSDVTAEELRSLTGKTYALPEGAENVAWRWMASEGMAEIRFDWISGEFCFRTQVLPVADGVLPDISGMYFTWEHEENITVAGCPGIIGIAQDGSESSVERCVWYDASAQTAYSLSVTAADVDGLDLAALAGQIVLPAMR